MVADKTASLISASCYLGYYSNDKDINRGEAIKNFGEYLGIAYQIKDDVFDVVGNIDNTGKKSNLDLKKNMFQRLHNLMLMVQKRVGERWVDNLQLRVNGE